MSAWKYDDPELREQILSGDVPLDDTLMKDMEETFVEWSQDDVHTILRSEVNGRIFAVLNVKRGNDAFAARKRKRVREIEKNIKGLRYDSTIDGLRVDKYRDSHFFLITTTFWHVPFDILTAWACIKDGVLNRFRTSLGDILGCSYGSFTVKEAQETGHPAPHILVIADRPFRFFMYRNHWRLQDKKMVDRIKKLWDTICREELEKRNLTYRLEGWEPNAKQKYVCNVDIEGVIGHKRKLDRKRSVISYVLKYMIKSIDPMNKTSLRTHVMQKFFRMRDHMSDAFKHRVNSGKDITRLDLVRNELKNLVKKIRDLEEQAETICSQRTAFGYLLSNCPSRENGLFAEIRRCYREEDELLFELPVPEWRFAGTVRTLDEYMTLLKSEGMA